MWTIVHCGSKKGIGESGKRYQFHTKKGEIRRSALLDKPSQGPSEGDHDFPRGRKFKEVASIKQQSTFSGPSVDIKEIVSDEDFLVTNLTRPVDGTFHSMIT